jgi:hypothetical protein
MKKAEVQYGLGVVGSLMATLLALMLALKYAGPGWLSLVEITGMVAVSIGVVRKSLWCLYAMAGYFGVVKAIPMLLSGNPLTVVVVIGVLLLLWQGAIGLVAIRGPVHPYPAPDLSDSDRIEMQQWGVEHNGEYFVAGQMHFDRLSDAMAHARRSRGLA